MQSNPIKVLYVDDEENNLNSFKATFRQNYTVLVATSAKAAMDILEQHPDIKVLITDQRMPETSGIEFLEQARKLYPKPVRMLITGYTDIESVIGAINKGHVYRYIKKPWEEQDLRVAIEEGYKHYMTHSLLIKKNEELQNAYNALDEFAYSITHGLRDPILSVISIVEIAKTTEDVTPEVTELLDMVCQSMLQLDSFIKNTHDYHRLTAEGMEVKPIWVKDIMTSIEDIYDIEASINDVTFNKSVKQEEAVNSSELVLNVVINNLLGNAFKNYTAGGSNNFVELNLEADAKNIHIEVKDNSTGLPESYIRDVFDTDEKRHEVHRTTLSLHNVKDAIQLMGGTITYHLDGNVNVYKAVIPAKN
ncbi:MAG: hybrid sensor histidine kinase/response regulator [Sphingobacteriales bacterium]|nr:MAG: hybrid sensor histidine kinase/response regulator [Sphingobacteriales bacterium]